MGFLKKTSGAKRSFGDYARLWHGFVYNRNLKLLFCVYCGYSQVHDDNMDQRFMKLAIDQAFIAADNGDVPVGAVIVFEDRVIAKAHNQRQLLNDPTAHAEIIALTQAAEAVGNWRLNGCIAYITLEPCPMCAGALVMARIDRLVFGCDDPKAGACGSLYNIVQDERLNHSMDITSGVLNAECGGVLSDFFKVRRDENTNKKQMETK
jgi:tRNA(adenine34) deaminase